jgi:hypothetical protein
MKAALNGRPTIILFALIVEELLNFQTHELKNYRKKLAKNWDFTWKVILSIFLEDAAIQKNVNIINKVSSN